MLPKPLLNVFYSLGFLLICQENYVFFVLLGKKKRQVSCHSFSSQESRELDIKSSCQNPSQRQDSALILKGSWVAGSWVAGPMPHGLCLYLPGSHGSPVHILPARKDADTIKPALSASRIWLHAGTMRQEGRRNPKPLEY